MTTIEYVLGQLRNKGFGIYDEDIEVNEETSALEFKVTLDSIVECWVYVISLSGQDFNAEELDKIIVSENRFQVYNYSSENILNYPTTQELERAILKSIDN